MERLQWVEERSGAVPRGAQLNDLLLRNRALEAIPHGVTVVDATDPDHPLVYASPGFERLTGYPAADVIGRNPRFLQGPATDPAAVAALGEAIAERREVSIELLNYRKNGMPFWNALTVSPVHDGSGAVSHFVGVQIDITEKRLLGEQVRESQRLEALGQLAGGIAHDFNNILTVIMGNAMLLVQTADLETRQGLDDILAAGDRATDLVRQLLAFSRQQPIEPGRIDLNDVVGDARKMLDRLIETTIDVRYEFADVAVPVVVDRAQIEQVLINLAVNARDAMPGGGRLTIATGVDGDMGTLAVRDSGTGIDASLRDRIFTPFFTTKEVGKGTGLGLAAAYGIVDAAGGSIEVESEAGEGSTFTVRLPLVAGSDAAEAKTRRVAVGSSALGGTRPLLVEDDPSVRAIAEELLIAAGCELVLVANSEHAIELTEDGEPFDVLITDLVMPRINGIELARAVRELRPDLPILFVSGYPQDKFDEVVAMPNSAYVPKPFDPNALQAALAKLLENR
jgi:PAS domain S-box-containing protein